MCLIFLTAFTATAFGALPPQYLSITNFKQCLASKNMGTWQAWCMPTAKPETCPNDSWNQLSNLSGKNRLPAC
jgi:hypothetical protein